MRNQTLAWAVVFVEHGLPFHFYAEEWEARAVCNAINSGNTGDTDYGECRVVALCEASIDTAKYWRDKMLGEEDE